MTIEDLPGQVRCSAAECGAAVAADRAPEAGWVLIDRQWLCRDHAAPRIDGAALRSIDELDDEATELHVLPERAS